MAREAYTKTKKDCIYYYFNSDGEKRYAYRYKFYDHSRVRREKSGSDFLTEKAAERALIAVKADVLDERIVFVQNSETLVSDWIKFYLQIRRKKWEPSTLQHYTETAENHLIPKLGHYRLHKLTNLIIQEELVDPLIEKGNRISTIENILRPFIAMLNYAVQREVLKKNPITELDYEDAAPNGPDQYYSEEELNDLLRCTRLDGSPSRIAIIHTLALTGMRRGEAMALRWSDIDFMSKTISITKTRDRYGERTPKSRRGIRKVHMNSTLVAELKSYYDWSKKAKWSKKIEPKSDDYVFITVKGLRPVKDSYTRDAMAYICQKHNLRFIKTHGLRHTFASILLSRNIPLITVAEMLGDHPTTVNNVYAHSLVKKETEASDLLDRIVSNQ
ncbi:site-specific integrase [Metasolibacillus sp.]|uniref:tyrosine-type recombinase/integrase n=1 Tax=Metasolibacillus sp. TaxID=2703680 RepID=UPI0025EF5CCF|nr:site-specific integrase [Metasolibacillus sp.]MCT6925267.1 site-specific integrase [Metasolibacillus sp.]MCT6941503.1 site-specific integrase [Metasolibacillus sp.]